MKYTIYKITNRLNNKIYIGKHQTDNIDDSYYGSGIGIVSAIKKYGKQNFFKEVLFSFDTEEEMDLKEKEIVTEEFIQRKDNYNAGIGGEGGPHFKGLTHKEETKEILRQKGLGRVVSEETRRRISLVQKGKITSEETKYKISVAALLRHHGSQDAVDKIIKERELSPKIELNRSESLKKYFSDPINRQKRAEIARRLHLQYDLVTIKEDFDNGMKPKNIMKKHNMKRTTWTHIREYYLICKK